MDEQEGQHDFLLGVGHPLLDVSVNVDEKFLDRYGSHSALLYFELKLLAIRSLGLICHIPSPLIPTKTWPKIRRRHTGPTRAWPSDRVLFQELRESPEADCRRCNAEQHPNGTVGIRFLR